MLKEIFHCNYECQIYFICQKLEVDIKINA